MNDLFRVRLDFPDNPALDDEFLAQNGATYRWDGVVWVPIGSGQGVYLPLAGGTMDAGSFLTLGANPNVAMHAATKQYVDAIATGARLIIGVIDGTNGRCIYSGATGLPPGPLVDASTVQSGSDVICIVAGTIPPDPLLPPEVWNMTMAVSDVLVSNGANWILVHIPRAPITAAQVATIPSVFGSNNVQDALMQAALQDMPPGGAIGQILTKRVGADYDTEWTDASDPVNYTNIFMNRTPGGSGAIDPNNFPIGAQSIWMQSGPVNCPPMTPGNTTGFWMINTYRAGSTKFQQAIEQTNTSPGPGTILAIWVRPGGNLDTTWGPWVQQSISNTDGAFVPLTGTANGAPMTGRLQITTAGGAETTDSGQLQVNGQTSRLEVASSTGGDFRYVNRGNDQGGLTWVSNGAPTYRDWCMYDATLGAGVVTLGPVGGGGVTVNGGLTVLAGGSFTGQVTFQAGASSALAPTTNASLCNKAYVDQLVSSAPILIGVIDAGTANCSFADGSVGPLPVATGSRHYIICTRPGTIPGGPAAGIIMRLGDELFDGEVAGVPRWFLIAVGTGGVLTTADQVALIPNVAGTNNVQAGMQVLDTNKLEKTGDNMTGSLRFPSSLANGPPGTANTNSAGMRVAIWDNPAGVSFGIGVESGAMWFNNAAANNLYKFYNAGVEKWRLSQNAIDCRHDGDKSINFLSANGTARWWIQTTIGGNDQVFQIAGRTDGGSSYAYLTINRASGQVTVPYGLNSLTVYGLTDLYRDQNTVGLRLRKNNNNSNTDAPSIEFTANDGRLLGAFVGRHLGGNGYYGTWPAEVRCDVGSGGYGRQTCWTTRQQGGGFHSLRVQGDVFARNVQLNSDVTMKSNVRPLDAEAVNAAFAHLNPVQFHWKPVSVEHHLAAPYGKMSGHDDDPDSVDWGFIADDIEAGAPDLVKGERGSKTYNLAGVVAVMAAKMKQMEAELVQLREEGKALMVEFVSGNVFIRVMGEGKGLKPGEKVGGHLHRFDHTSIFFCGNWHVTKWEPGGAVAFDFEREGPFHVLIEKDCKHEFVFLGGAEVGWAYCVYSHRTSQGEVSIEQTGWYPAYDTVAAQ